MVQGLRGRGWPLLAVTLVLMLLAAGVALLPERSAEASPSATFWDDGCKPRSQRVTEPGTYAGYTITRHDDTKWTVTAQDGYVLTRVCAYAEGWVLFPFIRGDDKDELIDQGDWSTQETANFDDLDIQHMIVETRQLPAELTVVKQVTNDDGGTRTAGDFQLYVDGQPVSNGQTIEVTPGQSHQVSESGPSGYRATFSGVCNANGMVTLGPGQSGTCTITNDDIAPTITIQKTVENDNGGTATADDFDFFIDNGPVSPGVPVEVTAGQHQVSEGAQSGYQSGAWGGDCDENGNVTLALAENATCTITNDDRPAKIIVEKTVVNDHGGDAQVSDFTVTLTPDGGSPITKQFDAQGRAVFEDLSAGTYVVSETGPSGYEMIFGEGCGQGTITVGVGDEIVCEMTNDDIAPTITVVKTLVNDDGGDAQASDFSVTLTPDGGSPITKQFDAQGQAVFEDLSAGTYTVSESGPSGYQMTLGEGCEQGAITVGIGEEVTCEITNDDIAPMLTVTKDVTNDDGGDAQASDFSVTLTPDGGSPITKQFDAQGRAVFEDLSAGTYTVSESGPDGYQASFSGDCGPDGSVTLQAGDEATCEITNDDIAPMLTVTKDVTNDDGGDAQASDFSVTLTPDGGSPITKQFDAQGRAVFEDLSAGTYTVSESGPSGYQASFSGDCGPDGSVTLQVGDEATCEITNDDLPATIIITKTVVNDNDGGATADDFSVTLTPDGGSPITKQFDAQGRAVFEDLSAGTYTVSESGPSGYQMTLGEGCEQGAITVGIGEEVTCEIENDDIPATLTVIKELTLDDGRQASPEDFEIVVSKVDEVEVTFLQLQLQGETEVGRDPGSAEGVTYESLNAGTYRVAEPEPGKFTPSFGGDCAGDGTVELGPGESATCIVTNDDIPIAHGTLTVITNVVNDHGGTAQPGDVQQQVLDGGSDVAGSPAAGDDAGVVYTLDPATYTVQWATLAGYEVSVSGDCDAATGEVSVGEEEAVSCVITYDDLPATLIVLKEVQNDDGGELTAEDFAVELSLDGTSVDSKAFDAQGEAEFDSLSAGTYTVAETDLQGYTATFGEECAEGVVTLGLGETVTCTVTNDDPAPEPTEEPSPTPTPFSDVEGISGTATPSPTSTPFSEVEGISNLPETGGQPVSVRWLALTLLGVSLMGAGIALIRRFRSA